METKEKIKYLKDIRELFIQHIMEIETIGYDFYDQNNQGDQNELYAIIEIEQQCRNLKILINNFYSNKIEKLSIINI
jgi:hypothetical protein